MAQFLLFSGGEKEIATKMRVIKEQATFLEKFTDKQDKEFVDEVGKSWTRFWEESTAAGMLVENLVKEIIDTTEFSIYLTKMPVSEDPTLVQERNKQWEGPLFNFVKNHSNGLVIVGYEHLYHPTWGLLSRFLQLGLSVQELDVNTGGLRPFYPRI